MQNTKEEKISQTLDYQANNQAFVCKKGKNTDGG